MKCFMTNQDCIFEKEIQKRREKEQERKSLFVVSPFGYPYDEMYEKIIRPAAEAASIEPQRADRAFQLGFVMCTKICRLIQEADYVVADLTEDNPNVFYELGLAWGFGKRIVVVRDEDADMNRAFKEIFGGGAKKVLSYERLLPIERQSEEEKAASLLALLTKDQIIDVEKECLMESKRAQGAYIASKCICLCYRKGTTDQKFYYRAVEDAAREVFEEAKKVSEDAARQVSPNQPWGLSPVPITQNSLSKSLPERLSSSKVLVVDVTHYASKPDTSVYFALGLSHAMGRETIPITNKAKCSEISPFDVRGLWQVYFSGLGELKSELVGILKVIDRQYEAERADYPLRFIWDEVLRHSGELTVLTCARGAAPDVNRAGGRTNVDKWDYISIAKLAFFLATKYRMANMDFRAPEEKLIEGLERDKQAKKITENLCAIENSVVIIGSPDVSDYAEVVLARMYCSTPYQPEKCRQESPAQQRRCWEHAENQTCVGKRGYLFYKTTVTPDHPHPRELSAFFRAPPGRVKECVLWYGERYECEHNLRGENAAEGETFGVLTLLKDREDLFAPGKSNRWIILLSGFTGIATYGLARLLTSLDVKTTEGNSLQQILKDKRIDIEADGMQVLVSVRYKSKTRSQDCDTRELVEPDGITIVDVKPAPGGRTTPVTGR